KCMIVEWEKRISRGGGWRLKPNHTVCELHFEEKYIKSNHLDNVVLGSINLAHQRLKKTLTEDAVPTIFPSQYPSYKQIYKEPKRKAPTERVGPVPQRKRACACFKELVEVTSGAELQQLLNLEPLLRQTLKDKSLQRDPWVCAALWGALHTSRKGREGCSPCRLLLEKEVLSAWNKMFS
ncbi:Ribosomal RNA small subunit methyltransferase F, partial [Frankliniella fusca]